MGKNKKGDVIGVALLWITVASVVITVSTADVSVAVKNCNDVCHKNCQGQGKSASECETQCGKCELQTAQGGSVVVEVVVNGAGSSSGGGSESTTTTEPSEPSSPTPTAPSTTPSVPAEGGGGSAAVEQSVKTLCQGSMYKEACETIMVKMANGSGSTEQVIKAGATLALQGIHSVFNLTGSLQPKNSKKPEAAAMAVDDCKELFTDSIEKLNEAITQIGDPNSYKTECSAFKLRLWLSDVLTYADNCMDTLGGAEAVDLQDVMKDGVANASEITMVVLDMFTGFSKAMNAIGINTDNVVDEIKSFVGGDEKGGEKAAGGDAKAAGGEEKAAGGEEKASGGGEEKAAGGEESATGGGENAAGSGRRLLGGGAAEMLGSDGLPKWLSAGDRRLLNLDGGRNERLLDGVPPNPPPNVVVAQDGSGQFKTIIDALKAYDPKIIPPGGKFVIYVKAGVYDEYILVDNKMKNIFMYGDGPLKTIVTGKKCYIPSLTGTMRTSTFSVQGAGFFGKDMAFENTAGPEGHQAVAFRSNGDNHVLLNCHFNGYQDTLYPQGGSQFFRDCLISGTVDFIFGNGATVFQNCEIVVRMPLPNQFNAVTAQGRTGPSMPTGIVIQGCRIVADPRLDKVKIKSYLGRAWKEFARTVFMFTDIGDMIAPEGYTPFDIQKSPNTQDSFWGEFKNTGPGAATGARVNWPKVNKDLPQDLAQTYSPGAFLPGADAWLKPTGVPYYLGLTP